MDQYLRRDFVEIKNLPATRVQGNTNHVTLKVAEKIGVDLAPSNISVSHRLPKKVLSECSRNIRPDAIIINFIRQDVKEKFYCARKNQKNLTAVDFGQQLTDKIFINENLTRKNKKLFNSCPRIKKDKGYKFIWTSSGKVYLRKNEVNLLIHIESERFI